MEEYLSLSETLIKQHEKINKGIKKLNEKEEKKNINMIKLLTYISKINKNQKEMQKFSEILKKNIKLNFVKDNINYEEYYFNGLSIPKDIQFSNNTSNGFKISWALDDINLLNIDKNKIKYKVEIRKENEKFKLIYEDNNNNCIINNLYENTNYEIRICSFYNNIISNWTQIYNIKTDTLSVILYNEERKKEYINKILEWTGYKSIELI